MAQAFRHLLPVGCALLAACSAWQQVARYEAWSLYRLPGSVLDARDFEAAFEPAARAVEHWFGPFPGRVRVHAWDEGRNGSDLPVEELPGGALATVPAWHQRGGGWSRPDGVYVTRPDVGGAVHELIHAWFSLTGEDLPLWFEEGVAMFFGDGALVEDEWVVDGLACWPMQQLRSERLAETEIERLLQVERGAPLRDDLYVHFVGWAAVFDLAHESGSRDWRAWRELSRHETPAQLAQRVARSLDPATQHAWLARLEHDDPAVRVATARGTWKLASSAVCERLLSAWEREREPEVALTLALSAAACAGEVLAPNATRRRARDAALEALADARERLSPREGRAADSLIAHLRGEREEPAELARAWEVLRHYWDE